MTAVRSLCIASSLLFLFSTALGAEDGLVAHWRLKGNTQDSSGHKRHAINHGVTWDPLLPVIAGVFEPKS